MSKPDLSNFSLSFFYETAKYTIMQLFASSLDTAGLLGHTAEDCAMVLGSMVGFDPYDSTSVEKPTEDFTRDLNAGVKGLRIGVPARLDG